MNGAAKAESLLSAELSEWQQRQSRYYPLVVPCCTRCLGLRSGTVCNVTAIGRVIGVLSRCYPQSLCYHRSRESAESSARMPVSPVGFCPTLPIFLKLPKLSLSRMGHYGQSQTLGQGQYTYPPFRLTIKP